MEAFAYVLILTLAVVTLFFAVAFRDPPKFDRKWTKKKKPLVKEVFFIVHFLSNLGGSLKATAKNKVTTARVRIRT